MGLLKDTGRNTSGSDKIVLGLIAVLAIMILGIVVALIVDIFVVGADLVLDPDLATLFATIGGAVVGAAAGYVKQPQDKDDNVAVEYDDLLFSGEDTGGTQVDEVEPAEVEEVEIAEFKGTKGKSKGKSKGRSKDKVVALAGAEEVAEKSKEKAGPLADDEDDFELTDDEDDFELTGDEEKEFEEDDTVAQEFFDDEETDEVSKKSKEKSGPLAGAKDTEAAAVEYEVSEPEELDLDGVPSDYEGEDPGFDDAPEAPEFGAADADWFNEDSDDESSDDKVEEGVDKDAKK